MRRLQQHPPQEPPVPGLGLPHDDLHPEVLPARDDVSSWLISKLRAVVLDCPDPRVLAEFYKGLVGGEVTYADDEWVALRDGGDVRLSFQLALDYQPPVWPSADRPQQFHIDVTVDDVDVAEPLVLALGARRHEVQPPEGEAWRVYLDPAGHPFCLCWD
jgi:hypothetical protein